MREADDINTNVNNNGNNNANNNNVNNNNINNNINNNVNNNDNDVFYADNREIDMEDYTDDLDQRHELYVKDEELKKSEDLFADLLDTDDAELEDLSVEKQKAKQEEQNRFMANAAQMKKEAEEKEQQKDQEKKDEAKKDDKKAKKDEPVVTVRKVRRKDLGQLDYESEQRGYVDQDFEEGATSKQAEDVHVMKYTMLQIFPKGHRSVPQKQIIKDLTAFDAYMKEIGGRTRLTPREMEVYDALSLKAYRSGKEYLEYKQQQKEKKMEAYEEKHANDKKYKPYEESQEDIVKVNAVTQMMENIERLRKETFEKEIEEKTKEMTEKCQKEAEKAEAQREQLEKTDDPQQKLEIQATLEDTLAKSIFYSQRIEKLQEKGELKMKPDESFTKAKERLDKSTEATKEELDKIKQTDFFKELKEKAMNRVEAGESLGNDEIMNDQKEYIQAEGSKKAMQKWREKNMQPVKKEPEKNNELEKNMQLNNKPQSMAPM
jgi:hypothetical protein